MRRFSCPLRTPGRPGPTRPAHPRRAGASLRSAAALLIACLALAACGPVWNDPYPVAERGEHILYTAFTERPKHLDPVQSYSEDEASFLYQIVEPPLQYHYLTRP